jgi:hypothetical protein
MAMFHSYVSLPEDNLGSNLGSHAFGPFGPSTRPGVALVYAHGSKELCSPHDEALVLQ